MGNSTPGSDSSSTPSTADTSATETHDAEVSQMLADQGLEIITEAELRGDESTDDESTDDESTDDESTDDESTDDESTDDESTDDESTDDESTDDESTDDESADDESADDDDDDDESEDTEPSKKPSKPPKGFVPLKALQENRTQLKEAKADIEDLKQQIKALATKPKEPEVDPEFKGFKLLSDEEYEELVIEDPAKALIYSRQEAKFHKAKNAKDAEQKELKDIEEANNQFIEDITTAELSAMSKVVPGIFDDDSDVRDKLKASAEKVGFTSDMFYLTDPGTQIILRGETEPKLLGSQATSIIKVLASITGNKEPKVDSKKLESDLRKSITTELLAKFKTKGSNAFRSLSDAPKTPSKKQKTKSKNLTEGQVARLSDEELQAYLSGE